jgi:hypothetical protein
MDGLSQGNKQMLPTFADGTTRNRVLQDRLRPLPAKDLAIRRRIVTAFIRTQTENRLSLQTLFLAVHILDRILGECIIPKHRMQVVTAIVLKIAMAYEDDDAMSTCIADFWAGHNYLFRELERKILGILNYDLGWPGPLFFLNELLFTGPEDITCNTFSVEEIATFLLKVSLLNEKAPQLLPSVLAMATYGLAVSMLENTKRVSLRQFYQSETMPIKF